MPSVVVAFTLIRSILDAQNFRDARAHGFAVRADLGPLADQGHVAMHDAAAFFRHQPGGMVEEFPARRAAPAFVAGRKMLADIAGADAAQDGVGEGMQAGIGIGMAFKPMIVRHLHAAEPDMIAVA